MMKIVVKLIINDVHLYGLQADIVKPAYMTVDTEYQ